MRPSSRSAIPTLEEPHGSRTTDVSRSIIAKAKIGDETKYTGLTAIPVSSQSTAMPKAKSCKESEAKAKDFKPTLETSSKPSVRSVTKVLPTLETNFRGCPRPGLRSSMPGNSPTLGRPSLLVAGLRS